MNTYSRLRGWWLGRVGIGFALVFLSMAMGGSARAQTPVEKLETTQQAKQPEDEQKRARAAVTRPTEKQEMPTTGRIVGNYVTNTTLELGYRWENTKGNRNYYLSHNNEREGFRLMDFSFDARSINGDGALFDYFRVAAENAGGDASQTYSVHADKTRAYDFRGSVRRFYYFRSLPNFANGQHNHDLRQQVSDFALKLFPQRAVKLNLGYGRAMAKGPVFTTYDYERDEFPILGEARWEANDFRVGIDAKAGNWDFYLEEFYRGFRDDTEHDTVVNPVGNNTTNTSRLTFLDRDTPVRTRALFTKASLRGDITRRLHLLVRGIFGEEDVDAAQFETPLGTDSSNRTIVSRRIAAIGNVERPSRTLDALLSYDIAENVTVSNSLHYTAFDINGDVGVLTTSTLRSAAGAVTNTTTNTSALRGLDVDSLWNTLELNFALGRKFTGNLGWRFTNRQVELTRELPSALEEEDQSTHTFIGGLRFRPVRRTSFFLDYEAGETDNVFVRINPLEFQRLRLRTNVQVTDALSVNGVFTSTDRKNPTPFVENDADFRGFAVSALYEPGARWWVTGGYNYDTLDSFADIVFISSGRPTLGRSFYYSRQHFGFFESRVGVTNRLDLFMVYRYIRDRGVPSDVSLPTTPVSFVSALPLSRHNPEARVAYRFSNNVTGNLSYRHYSYNERFFANQDYRSNLVTTSVRVTF